MKTCTRTLIFLLLSAFTLVAQNSNMQMQESLVLGDTPSNGDEYLFSDIKQLCTDAEGRIYILDQPLYEIAMFNASGEFQQTIGRSGQGPGEFLYITSFLVHDITKQMTVFDAMNQRVTSLDADGNPLYIQKFPAGNHLDYRYTRLFGNDKLLVYEWDYEELNPNEPFLHIYNTRMTEKLCSFGKAGNVWDLDKEEMLSQMPTSHPSMVVLDSTRVVFVPYYYRGELYAFRYTGDTWEMATWHGQKHFMPPYKVGRKKGNLLITSVPSGPAGTFYFQANCRTIGLFTVGDDYIIHFTKRRIRKREHTVNYELFDCKGALVAYGELETSSLKPASAYNQFIVNVLWKDREDNFYLYCLLYPDEDTFYPVIRKAAIINLQDIVER
ncbi:6-bladed beta-propeller [bacterium]|nr:6-bladed beta-propeller [bacterium]